MRASRDFIDPRTQPPRFVAVELPRDASFTIYSGPWRGPFAAEKRTLADPIEALEAHIAFVGELLDAGFVELGPWLAVKRDAEPEHVRPPMTRFFETRQRDELRREDCGTVAGALAAFAAWLGLRPGCRLEAPPWGENDVDTDLFDERTEHFEDDPAALKRRYYQREAAPHDEFGPELWLFPSGATRRVVSQLLTKAQGVVAEWYESGQLRGLLSHHNDELRGPALTFCEEDGTIEARQVYDTDGGRRGVLIYDDGELFIEGPEGSTADDERRGLWTTHRADGRHETFYDPPGHERWTKVYRPDSDSLAKLEEHLDDELTRTTHYSERGLVSLVYETTPEGIDVTNYHDDGETIASIGRCLPNGEREGEWRLFDAQGEPRAVCHYRADTKCGVWTSRNKDNVITKTYRPDGTRESILWERHDGTLEVRKTFDENDNTQTIEAFREDSSLGRRLYRIGSSDDWAMETFLADGTTVASTGPIDSEGRYHGVITELNPDGEKIGESKWEHGEQLSSTTGAEIEIVTPQMPKRSMKPLFDCLEQGAYVPAPAAGYGGVNASAPDLPETLESHLAWLHCVANEGIDALAPAKPRGVWRHRSDAGSELRLKRARTRLKQAIVTRADGTRAAEADYIHRANDENTPVHIDVRIYHPDGASLRRWGTCEGSYPWNARSRLHVYRRGWWYEAAADGRVLRAQYFASGLDADHRYEALYDHSTERSKRGFAAIEEAAVKAASKAPSRAAFVKICRLVEEAALVDEAQTREVLIPRLRAALEAWPSRLRMAPWLWINRLLLGALPLEALHLVSALSLTAAIAAHYLNTPHYPLLLRWLADYPADGPTVEGISMSFSDDVASALRKATKAERQARYHPKPGRDGSLDFDQTYHYDSDHLPVLLGSPLLRDVRVLDASWEPTSRDFDWDYQGILDGRGLTLGDVAEHLSSERLEVLSLRGQCSSPRSQLSRRSPVKAHKQRLRGLKVLNLGGGHPLGDATLKDLAALTPALEELSIRPGEAGRVLSGYDFDEWDPSEGRDSVYGRLHEHWEIYGNDDIAKMRATNAAWEALAKLPLRRVTLGTMHDDHRFADDVDVAILKCYELQLRPRVAAWEAYFDA